MWQRKRKSFSQNLSTHCLIQTAITSFFNPVKGPLKFDATPLRFSKEIFKERSARKKLSMKKNALESDKDSDATVSGVGKIKVEKIRKPKASVKNKGKRPKVLPSDKDDDNDDIVFVGEYKMTEETKDSDDVDKENDDLTKLSPNIILHTNDEDVLFTSQSTSKERNLNTEKTDQMDSSKFDKDDSVMQSPSKRKRFNSSEDADDSSVSNGVRLSSPIKEITLTRSLKQSTELQKRSRILQMNGNVSSNQSAVISEYISTDFLETSALCDNVPFSDATLTNGNVSLQNRSTTNTALTKTVNFVTQIQLDRPVNVDKTIKNVGQLDVSSTLENDELTSEKRRKYLLSLIDTIVENAKRKHLCVLLFEHDKNMLQEYMNLPDHYKFLCCKLFTYTSKWHNLSKFVCRIKLPMNDFEITTMHAYLLAKNIISKDFSTESSVCLLDLLQTNDVKDIHKSLKLKSKKNTKPILIKSILEHSNQQTTLTSSKSMDKIVREKICQKLGVCIKLTDCFYNMFYKIHLLYSFTNPEFAVPSDLYFFMSQVKNGEISLPYVTCEDKTVFKNAEEFARFAKACDFKNEVLLEFDRRKKSDNMLELCRFIYAEFKQLLHERSCLEDAQDDRPGYLKRFSAGNKYSSALTFACRQMTTVCPNEVQSWLELLLSQEMFCQHKRGFWYCQLSMVYNKYMKDPEKAAEILVTALKDKKLSVIDLSDLSYKGKGYSRKKMPNTTKSIREELSSLLCDYPDSSDFPSVVVDAVSNHRSESGAKSLYQLVNINGDIEFLNVEQVAISHYINKKGFLKGIHCEGALMSTIFTVLFWDVLYSPSVSKLVPFAFISELQYLPLDFGTTDFYFNRRVEIEDRIGNLRAGWSMDYLQDYVDIMWNSLSHKKSLIAPNIVVDAAELYDVILCIGRHVVSEVCRRLVENFREHRAGMPDLFLWNATTKRSKFVEVKGPGDKLSTKQKIWLQFLKSSGADVEVCHVHPVGSNKSHKYKAKPKVLETGETKNFDCRCASDANFDEN